MGDFAVITDYCYVQKLRVFTDVAGSRQWDDAITPG
jgi:hypothetical protein